MRWIAAFAAVLFAASCVGVQRRSDDDVDDDAWFSFPASAPPGEIDVRWRFTDGPFAYAARGPLDGPLVVVVSRRGSTAILRRCSVAEDGTALDTLVRAAVLSPSWREPRDDEWCTRSLGVAVQRTGAPFEWRDGLTSCFHSDDVNALAAELTRLERCASSDERVIAPWRRGVGAPPVQICARGRRAGDGAVDAAGAEARHHQAAGEPPHR
jgi:hypothetical protein